MNVKEATKQAANTPPSLSRRQRCCKRKPAHSFIHSTCVGSSVCLLELDLTAMKRAAVSGLTELSLKDTDGKTGNYTTQQSCMGGRTGLYRCAKENKTFRFLRILSDLLRFSSCSPKCSTSFSSFIVRSGRAGAVHSKPNIKKSKQQKPGFLKLTVH